MTHRERFNITQNDIEQTARIADFLNKKGLNFLDFVGRCYEYATRAFAVLKQSDVECEWMAGFSILKESENGLVHLINHSWVQVNEPLFGEPFTFDPLHIFGVGGILVANFGVPSQGNLNQACSNDLRLMRQLLPKVHEQNRKNGHHSNYGGLFLNYYRRMMREGGEENEICYASAIKWLAKTYKAVDGQDLVYRKTDKVRLHIVATEQTPFGEGMAQFKVVNA